MRRASIAATLLLLAVNGCTLFPDQQPAPLALTTSAERTNQVFWQDVAKANWDEVRRLVGGEVTWTGTGSAPITDAGSIVSSLQQSGIHTAVVADAQVRESGETAVVTFTLQTNNGSHRMMSVWQRLPGKKAPAPFQLIAMAQLG